jgi:CDP-glucose 4,6-dehydratase
MKPNLGFWKHRNVFITGATGLLGSELTLRLADAGADVVVLVRDGVPQSRFYELGLHNRVKVVRGDLEDAKTLARTLSEYEIDTVFHLAAQTIVGTAERDPVSTLDTNIRGTYVLLEACRHQPLVKRILVASSDKAYGTQEKLPYDESTPLQGLAPYDVSKSCADLICNSYFFTYKLPITVTRCGNFFGPGDLNFNRIIPGTIRSLFYNEAPIIRSNGKYIRDYIYVGDGALAYIDLAEQLEAKNLFGEAFNFSYGEKRTVLDVVDAVAKAMDKTHIKPSVLGQAQKEIPAQYLSSDKAHRVLGWKATYDFEEGLRRTVPWYVDRLKAEEALKRS